MKTPSEMIAVVTGGSGGIGQQTALALARRGCRVYELSRHGADQGQIRHITCDVSQEAQTADAIAAVAAEAGRIDILVCNAGCGISGAAEFTDNAEAKGLLEVNLFGVVNCCKAAIPIMRAQGSGRIVCLSSVAGEIPIPFQAWYSVSKAAISSYAGALRNELRPFGISVCAIMPGDIRSGFTAARNKNATGDDVYGGRIAKSVAGMEHDEQTGMLPETAGTFIATIALRKKVKPGYAIGLKYQFFSMLIKLLPARTASWIVYLLYAK